MPDKIFYRFGSVKNKNFIGVFILSLFLFFMCPCSNCLVNAQTLPNLDIFYKLADSSVTNIVNSLSPDTRSIFITHSLVNDYSIFQGRILSDIRNNNKEVLTSADSAKAELVYSIENARVKYSDVFRDGFFGDYKVKRELSLKGNFIISEKGSFKKQKSFEYTSSDVINYDDINNIENPSFSFTRGEVPAEPFFSSLMEPIVAIGSAAVAVYLFFTVRSK